jgi:GntR family transcriptional regulator
LSTLTVPGAGPLYRQVHEVITRRISGGEWAPGTVIPSELRLAEELGVSQGTVRKAIDELVGSNVLVRQQGKGTFVAIHDIRRALFHFFHIVGNDGHRVLPHSRVLTCRRLRATRPQAEALNLPAGARVIRIERTRDLNRQPTIVESILLPAEWFPDLGKSRTEDLPNTLYELYEERYGVTIHRAEEHLRAVGATPGDAELLDVREGHPLLEITRKAYTLDGTPVELRVSRCLTTHHHYQSSFV